MGGEGEGRAFKVQEPTWPHTRRTLFLFPLRVKEIETHNECTADPWPHGIKDFEQNNAHLSQACWATLPATAPVGTAGRPRWAGLLSRRRGAGAGPPPLAAPHGRQTVPRVSPGASRCAVGWELREQRARSEAGSCSERGPALPVETNIYKQGLSLLLAGLELSILIFRMGNSN